MKTYSVLQQRGLPRWEDLPVALIDRFCWKDAYQPLSKAQLCLVDGSALALRLWSYETPACSVCTELDGPVHRDSCIECFLDPFPERSDRYVNFECNHKGCLLIHYGSKTDGRPRGRTANLGLPHPAVSTFTGSDGGGDYWGVGFTVPLSFFAPIYGPAALEAGHVMRGGFFKCGDDTPHPHFGSWQDIDFPVPNFHLPQFFGDLTIGPDLD